MTKIDDQIFAGNEQTAKVGSGFELKLETSEVNFGECRNILPILASFVIIEKNLK